MSCCTTRGVLLSDASDEFEMKDVVVQGLATLLWDNILNVLAKLSIVQFSERLSSQF